MVVQQTHPKREDSNRVKVIVSPVGRQGRPGTPGVSIRFFDTLQEALDLQPRPENGVTFQVREETDPENFGFYVFDDREPEGYRYLGERWDDEYLTQIENRIDAFEQSVEGQIQGLDTRVEGVEADVDGFKAEVEDRVEGVESDMSGFKTEVNQRVEDAEDAVQSLQDTTARYAFDTLQEAQDKWDSFSQEEKDELDGKEYVIDDGVYKWTDSQPVEGDFVRELNPIDPPVITLLNRLNNPDFSNGTVGWTTKSVGAIDTTTYPGFVEFQPTSSRWGFRQNHDFIKGHKYLVYMEHEQYSHVDVPKINITFYQEGVNPDPYSNYIAAPRLFSDETPIPGLNKNAGIIEFQEEGYNLFEVGWLGELEGARIGNIILLDLTEDYGKGNEPTNQEAIEMVNETGFFKKKETRITKLIADAINDIKHKYSVFVEKPPVSQQVLDLNTGDNFIVETTSEPTSVTILNPSLHQTVNILLKVTAYPATVQFPNITWQNGESPIFNIGHSYVIFLQTFNGGGNWIGSSIGAWKIPSYIVEDTFNRPDSSLLGSTEVGNLPWETNGSVWSISNQRIVCDNIINVTRGIAYIDLGNPDGIIHANFKQSDVSNRLCFRVTDDENLFWAGWQHPDLGHLAIGKIENNSPAILVSVPFIPTMGMENISIKLSGDTISLLYNGNNVATVSSSFNTLETKHGLISNPYLSQYCNSFKIEEI